jgi:hypothetical protein
MEGMTKLLQMVASNRLLKLIIGLLVVKTNLVLVAEKSRRNEVKIHNSHEIDC